MLCEFVTLSESRGGKILKCGKCADKVCLMYKNIVQGLALDDFYKLKKSLYAIDIEDYFIRYPQEERINIRTGIPYLFFAFTAGELYELRALIFQAELKIKLYEKINNNLN